MNNLVLSWIVIILLTVFGQADYPWYLLSFPGGVILGYFVWKANEHTKLEKEFKQWKETIKH